jgi:hypothetical protein
MGLSGAFRSQLDVQAAQVSHHAIFWRKACSLRGQESLALARLAIGGELQHRIAICLADPLELLGAEPQIEGQPQRRKLLFWRLGSPRGGRQGHSVGWGLPATLRTSGGVGEACW